MRAIQCNNYKTGSPFYFLDSNSYIEFSRFYYNGKCGSDKITEFVKDLLIQSQVVGGVFQFEFAANETAFDYGTNGINVDAIKSMFFAVDTLITQFSREEILIHKGSVGKPFQVNRNNACHIKSIYDCSFPQVFITDENLRPIYYLSYLYRLKIQEIYQQKSVSPIDRIKQLFFFMNDTIGAFADIEFQLGKMLFLGKEAHDTARSVLKVDKAINLSLINNTVADIVLFRICQRFGSLVPFPVFFVSGDDGLIQLFELNKNLVSGSNMVSLNEDYSDIKPFLEAEWNDFYVTELYPNMKNKFITSFFNPKKYEDIAETVKREIVRLEKDLY